MKREEANKLTLFVNQKNFEVHVKDYVEHRLEGLRRSLEVSSDQTDIYRIQGAIREVKRLLTLRDEVKQAIS